jgi:hypothetical protein
MKKATYLLITAISFGVILACSAIRSIEILPTDEPPGVGEKAEKGYAASEPVIAALDQYRADHGVYPEKLAGLVPEYLLVAPTKTDELDFSYSSTGESYSFSFHYRGPGLNTCSYTPEEEWKCSGAY